MKPYLLALTCAIALSVAPSATAQLVLKKPTDAPNPIRQVQLLSSTGNDSELLARLVELLDSRPAENAPPGDLSPQLLAHLIELLGGQTSQPSPPITSATLAQLLGQYQLQQPVALPIQQPVAPPVQFQLTQSPRLEYRTVEQPPIRVEIARRARRNYFSNLFGNLYALFSETPPCAEPRCE